MSAVLPGNPGAAAIAVGARRRDAARDIRPVEPESGGEEDEDVGRPDQTDRRPRPMRPLGLVDLGAASPRRLIDWRWQRAGLLLELGIRWSRRRDDGPTRRAKQYRAALRRCGCVAEAAAWRVGSQARWIYRGRRGGAPGRSGAALNRWRGRGS
jgi:hypothetical protein